MAEDKSGSSIIFNSPLTPGMNLNTDGNESLSDFLEDQNLTEFSADVEKNFQTKSVSVPAVKMNSVKAPKAVKIARGYGPKKNVQRKRFNCAVENCQYSTPYSKDLARHMRKHTGEKPFQCPQCNKTFSRYDKLKTHIMTHDGIRPYKCDICAYASVDSGSLRKHLRTHTNERPYKCQLCPYQARDSSQLVVHLRHHTGDTPYICTHQDCKAAFKTPSDLQRHFRLHTGEKPYGCPHCTYRAAVKCNLTVHVRKVHKNNIISDTNDEAGVLVSSVVPNADTESESSILKETYLSPLDSIDDLHNFKEIADNNSCNLEEPSQTMNTTNSSAQNQNQTTVISGNHPLPTTPTSVSKSPTKTARRKASHSKTTKLPFQYACILCPVKCDTIKAFKNHSLNAHKDNSILPMVKSLEAEAKSVIVSASLATTKNRVLKTDVVKPFECQICPASFAREDSLRCHLRQHSNNYLAAVRGSSLPSSTFPTLASSATTTSSSILPNQQVMAVLGSHPTMPVVSSHSPFGLSSSDLNVNLNVFGMNNFTHDPTALVPTPELPTSQVNSVEDADEPLIVRGESSLNGQTQSVYVIVRNEKVPEMPENKQ